MFVNMIIRPPRNEYHDLYEKSPEIVKFVSDKTFKIESF